MHNQLNQNLTLENNLFKEVMLEAKDLINKARRYKYNLMHEEGLRHYEVWAPYILTDISSEIYNSPGYKIAFLQVMSIIMALRGEDNNLHEELSQDNNDKKIINFLSYKASKENDNIYNIIKG